MSPPRDTIHSPTLANLSPENWPLLLLVNTYVVDRSVQIVRVNDLATRVLDTRGDGWLFSIEKLLRKMICS